MLQDRAVCGEIKVKKTLKPEADKTMRCRERGKGEGVDLILDQAEQGECSMKLV